MSHILSFQSVSLVNRVLELIPVIVKVGFLCFKYSISISQEPWEYEHHILTGRLSCISKATFWKDTFLLGILFAEHNTFTYIAIHFKAFSRQRTDEYWVYQAVFTWLLTLQRSMTTFGDLSMRIDRVQNLSSLKSLCVVCHVHVSQALNQFDQAGNYCV